MSWRSWKGVRGKWWASRNDTTTRTRRVMIRENLSFLIYCTVREVKWGRTPNSYIMCNLWVKFGRFLQCRPSTMSRLCSFAMGHSTHYAQLERRIPNTVLSIKIRHWFRIVGGHWSWMITQPEASNLTIKMEDLRPADSLRCIFYHVDGSECFGSEVVSGHIWARFLSDHRETKEDALETWWRSLGSAVVGWKRRIGFEKTETMMAAMVASLQIH